MIKYTFSKCICQAKWHKRSVVTHLTFRRYIMSRVLIGIISGVGGFIIGGLGGRKTSNITMKDVKAAPGKAGSAVLSAVKKTGRKIGSSLSSLAFWKKKAKRVNKKPNSEKNYRDLSVKHDKLEDDFSTAVKGKNTAETQLAGVTEQLRQAKEQNETFKNTFAEKDGEVTKANGDKTKAEADLVKAQNTIKKMEKDAA